MEEIFDILAILKEKSFNLAGFFTDNKGKFQEIIERESPESFVEFGNLYNELNQSVFDLENKIEQLREEKLIQEVEE